MIYTVYVKDTKTEKVTLGDIFTSKKAAERWVDSQQSIWGEDRGYKIVEDGDS